MSRRCTLALFVFLGPLLLAAAAAPVDVLIVAEEPVLAPLRARLASPQVETRAAWRLWLGRLGHKHVALARTLGDPLNAVAATTLAIRAHPPRLVLTCGTARRHDLDLRAGDVVVSERFVAFDGIVSPVTPLGGGSDPARWERLPHALMHPDGKERPVDHFSADAAALALAKKLSAPHGRLLAGVLGSAGQYNAEPDRLVRLRELWGTSCEDDASAHVAGCAQLFGVPAIGLRVIERTETPPGSAAPYPQYGIPDPRAQQDAAALAFAFLESLP